MKVVEYDGLHGITPRYLLFVHLLAFCQNGNKGDHEHTLSDTFLQIVECVNLNIGLIAKDELVKIINKHFM